MIRTIARTQVLKSVPVSRLVLPSLSVSRSYATKAQNLDFKKRNSDMPYEVYREVIETIPMPMREEFMGTKKLSSEQLEKINFEPGKHYIPQTAGDKMAYYMVKALRTLPDTYFGKDHYMRAVMLETIAAVPGMVGSMLRHLHSLRNMSEDNGWISHLLHEAENERMHLMTWMKCLQPSLLNRLIILGAQGVFFNAYFFFYLVSPKNAHRMCGYLEEEAVISYTHFLDDIDKGIIQNSQAPVLAIDYYNLHPNATIRDVVLAVRADEAVHRDANHFLSDRIANHQENIIAEAKNLSKDSEDYKRYHSNHQIA